MQRRAAVHADAFLAPRATLRALRSCEWVPRTALSPRLGALDDGAPDGAIDEDGLGPLIWPVVGPAEAAASSASSASSAVVGPTGVAASSAAMAGWSRSASLLLRLWSGLAPVTKLTKLAPLTKLTDSAYRYGLAHSAPIHGNATRMRALYPRTAAWAREQEQPSGGSLSGGSLSGGSASFDGAGAPLAALDGGIGAPLVSVCIVHHERGTLLKHARAHHGARRAHHGVRRARCACKCSPRRPSLALQVRFSSKRSARCACRLCRRLCSRVSSSTTARQAARQLRPSTR